MSASIPYCFVHPLITLIAARAANGVIGRDGDLPWRLKQDLAWFKRHTMNKPVIMGRKTFDSIGKALPKRRNIVITRTQGLTFDGAETAPGLEAALALCHDEAEIMIIGGAQIYAQSLALAQRLILTDIDRVVAGDTHFPAVDESQWQEVFREPHPETDPPFTFRILERVSQA